MLFATGQGHLWGTAGVGAPPYFMDNYEIEFIL